MTPLQTVTVRGLVLLIASCGSTQSGTSPEAAGEMGPCWIHEECGAYRSDAYLLGVGYGRDRVEAADAARANLAKIFSVRVQQTQEAVEAYESDGTGEVGSSRTSRAIRSHLVAETDALVEGVEIVERAEVNGRCYALAALDRERELERLDARLRSLAAEIERSAREEGTRVERLRRLARATSLAEEIEVLRLRHEIVAPDAARPSRSRAPEEITGLRQALLAQTTARIDLSESSDLSTVLTDAVTRVGLTVVAEDSADLRVTGTPQLERRATEEGGYTFHVVELGLQLTIEDTGAGGGDGTLRTLSFAASGASRREDKAERIASKGLTVVILEGDEGQPSLTAILAEILEGAE